MFEFFSREPRIEFLPWESWREKLGDEEQAEISYFHLARSGYFDISKEEKLLGYRPKYTNVDTIKIAVTSYLDRGVLVKDS
jgi:nucleoside-diphosphate-sugar epimerase